ncbi:MAG: tetratricopeptide repeat protein, partial [Pseudonocardiaceae bacterium]
MTRPAPDPEFLSPEGERAWTWLRRHLDRANAFWLAFVLTDDLTAQRVLRERVRANRRTRAQPLAVLQPATPAELADLLDELEQRGAAPPGCTWVAAPQVPDDEWLAAWRAFLLGLNHRRDVLRARLGGLVIAAPPAVKRVAQRESPDLWSVRDLLIELTARPAVSGSAAPGRDADTPRQAYGAQGLSYESADPELAEEAQVLLAVPVEELAGPARERVSHAVHRARSRGEHQLAAVLLLAQSDGYAAVGDPAGALHLAQEALTLNGVEPRTRERLLDSGVELAGTVSELDLARRYAADSVAVTEQRVSPEDPESLRDLSVSLDNLGDVTRDLGDPATAATHYQHALDIGRRLADQLNTARAHRDLSVSLS